MLKKILIIYDQPNMFETEKKLTPLLEGSSKSNIFKLRKVIVTKISQMCESGGLSQYLFVSDKFKDDITSISIKENRTLLIPCEDEYEVEIYGKETMKRFENDYNSTSKEYSPGGYTVMSFLGYQPFEYNFMTEVFNRLHPQIHHVLSIVKSSMERKFENYEHSKYSNTDLFVERYASIIAVAFLSLGMSYNEIIPYLIDLNTKLMSYPISKKTTYGSKPIIENDFFICKFF